MEKSLKDQIEQLIRLLQSVEYEKPDSVRTFCMKMANLFGQNVVSQAIDVLMISIAEKDRAPESAPGYLRKTILNMRQNNRSYRPMNGLGTPVPWISQTTDSVELRQVILALQAGTLNTPTHWSESDVQDEIEFLKLVLEEWDEINTTIRHADPLRRGVIAQAYDRYREDKHRWSRKLLEHKRRWAQPKEKKTGPKDLPGQMTMF